jgi:hypothetical protein
MKKLRLDPSDLLLEIVSIVIAILLAFALNAWNDQRKTDSAVHDSLVDIRREVEFNRSIVARDIARHAAFNAAYKTYLANHRKIGVQPFFTLFDRYAAHGFRPFSGESTAWDIARSLPSAIAIPLDLRTAIERTYAEQHRLAEQGQRVVDDLHIPATTDDPNLYLATIGISLDSGDVVSSERRLLQLDDALLKRLPSP